MPSSSSSSSYGHEAHSTLRTMSSGSCILYRDTTDASDSLGSTTAITGKMFSTALPCYPRMSSLQNLCKIRHSLQVSWSLYKMSLVNNFMKMEILSSMSTSTRLYLVPTFTLLSWVSVHSNFLSCLGCYYARCEPCYTGQDCRG